MTDEEKENFTNYDLDKWEKSHLPELRKNSVLKSQIMEKMSKIFNENCNKKDDILTETKLLTFLNIFSIYNSLLLSNLV